MLSYWRPRNWILPSNEDDMAGWSSTECHHVLCTHKWMWKKRRDRYSSAGNNNKLQARVSTCWCFLSMHARNSSTSTHTFLCFSFLKVLRFMLDSGLKPSKVVYTCLLTACAKLRRDDCPAMVIIELWWRVNRHVGGGPQSCAVFIGLTMYLLAVCHPPYRWCVRCRGT